MGEVFYHLNLLPSSDVVDISAQDLVTGYLGQTGKKTAETLHKARGKVLFIDEAYQLNPQKGGQYMQEAVDEIVKSLTSPEIRGNMVLILAGYENDMDEMLATNQGLRSRISKKIYFPDFSNNKICQLLKSELQKLEFRLTSKALQELPTLADRLRLQPGFSNGRDVEILSRKIMTNALRENKSIVTPDVLRTSFNELLRDMGQSKARSISNPTNSPSFVSIQQMMPAINFSSPPPMNTSHQMIRKKGVEPIQDLKSEQPVEDINQSFLQSLQIILDEKKLNSKEGIEQLLNLSENEFDELATELANRLDLDIDLVKQMIREWQKNQQKMLITLNDAERELANMKKTKKRGRVPIWRCAACGRANQPYIVCYVSPYVVRYEERDLN